MAQCSAPGCERKAVVKGYCGMHYHRLCRYGDTSTTKKAYRSSSPVCSVDGCTLPTLAKGLCGNHYALMRRNGEPVRTKVFTGEYIKDGYRYVMVGKRHYEPEHRLVMQRFLGRTLAPNEHVHHIDGDTLNNSPSNLQLVTRSEHMTTHSHQRPDLRLVTFNGETMCVAEWARRLDIPSHTIYRRLNRGANPEEALAT